MSIILFILNLFAPARKLTAQKAERMLALYKKIDAQMLDLKGRTYGYYSIASAPQREERLNQAATQLSCMRKLRDEIGEELSAFYNKPITSLMA